MLSFLKSENTIKISGVPNIGYEIEYKSMFKDIIDDLLGATKTEQKEKEFRFIATLACKAAVKGNQSISFESIFCNTCRNHGTFINRHQNCTI